MTIRILNTFALVGALGLLTACPDNSGTTNDESTGNPPPGTGTDTGPGPGSDTVDQPTGPTTIEPTDTTDGDTGTADSALCTNFGGYTGVQAVVGSFVGKVLANDKINAYFLTTDVDGGTLTTCLNKQVGEAVGCDGITYDCGGMKEVHAGMGISTVDFMDLAADFVAAMDEVPTLTAADKDAVVGVLSSLGPDIIEDADSNVSIYQRLGRKPGIMGVIGGPDDPESFIALVAGDASIVGFFANSDLERLHTCLVRQVTGATAGGGILSNIYGKEVDSPAGVDPGVSAAKPCLDMITSHKDLVDPGDGLGIQYADFGALVGHLVTAMNNKGVAMADANAILGALGPLCPMIVTVDNEMCG